MNESEQQTATAMQFQQLVAQRQVNLRGRSSSCSKSYCTSLTTMLRSVQSDKNDDDTEETQLPGNDIGCITNHNISMARSCGRSMQYGTIDHSTIVAAGSGYFLNFNFKSFQKNSHNNIKNFQRYSENAS
jgi:hypothetical protein